MQRSYDAESPPPGKGDGLDRLDGCGRPNDSTDSAVHTRAQALPYFRHFVANWAYDTEHLSLAETGALINLLGRCWSEGGSLPNDTAKLARYARATPDEWQAIGQAVMAMFIIDGDRLRHAGLTQELAHARAHRQQRVEAGRASGKARKPKLEVVK